MYSGSRLKPFTSCMGRLMAVLKYVLLFTVLSATTAHAYSQLFAWSAEGWSPNGTGSLPRTYTNVGGRGVDIVVAIAPRNRFVDTTPQQDGNNGLENHLDFRRTGGSTTFTFSFFETGTTTPTGVHVSDLTVKDLDSAAYQDAITFSAVPLGGGSMVPDQIQLYANTNLIRQGADTVYATSNTDVNVGDVEGWATATYNSQYVQSFSLEYHNGPDFSGNPDEQWMWISDFTFSGPDDGRYTYTECSPPFTDISGTGTRIISGDDDMADVTLPFSFLFYDTQSTLMTVGDNGGIIFGVHGGTLDWDNQPIPIANPAPAILPFWDDLNSGWLIPLGIGVYVQTLGTAPNRRFIVQWNNTPHYWNVGNATIQAILFEGSNDIFFVYPDVDFGIPIYDYGASATIGLNNGGGEALQYSYNTASLNGVDGICFTNPMDYGDAPLSYGDAHHIIGPLLYMGGATDAPDGEAASQYSADARGDNDNGTDDENGVVFTSPAGTGKSISADVTVHNGSASAVTLCAWLDISGGSVNNSFDAADGQCLYPNPGDSTHTFQWSGLPTDQQYTTYARFRLSEDQFGVGDATGQLKEGEVEDYQVIFDFTPTAVTIAKVDLEAAQVTVFLAGLGVEQMDRAALLALLQAWDPAAAAALTDDAGREEILAALRNYLDPDGDAQVAILAWDTLEERGTIGFYVDRRQGEQNGWTRINNDMLPGLITAPMGGEYRLADPGVTNGSFQYRLIEQEARGTFCIYGPYSIELK